MAATQTVVDWSLVSKHDLVLGWNVLGIYEKNMSFASGKNV